MSTRETRVKNKAKKKQLTPKTNRSNLTVRFGGGDGWMPGRGLLVRLLSGPDTPGDWTFEVRACLLTHFSPRTGDPECKGRVATFTVPREDCLTYDMLTLEGAAAAATAVPGAVLPDVILSRELHDLFNRRKI